nr:translation initiation factor IF-2-like [Anas platyrhynchos]
MGTEVPVRRPGAGLTFGTGCTSSAPAPSPDLGPGAAGAGWELPRIPPGAGDSNPWGWWHGGDVSPAQRSVLISSWLMCNGTAWGMERPHHGACRQRDLPRDVLIPRRKAAAGTWRPSWRPSRSPRRCLGGSWTVPGAAKGAWTPHSSHGVPARGTPGHPWVPAPTSCCRHPRPCPCFDAAPLTCVGFLRTPGPGGSFPGGHLGFLVLVLVTQLLVTHVPASVLGTRLASQPAESRGAASGSRPRSSSSSLPLLRASSPPAAVGRAAQGPPAPRARGFAPGPPRGGSEGGIEPVTARARWGGSGKQLSFTTARSVTAGGEGLSRCFKNSQQYF